MDRLTTWVIANLRWLRRQLARHGRTREEADDLIQEAYVRVFEYCEQGQAREPEKVLIRTVINLSINETRDRNRHTAAEERLMPIGLLDTAPDPQDVLNAEEQLRHVIRTLSTLDKRTGEAFMLNRMDGLSYKQVAAQMGISVSAVEKRIAWAMAVLLDAAERDEAKAGSEP